MSDNTAAQVARLRAIIDGEQYQESGDRAALSAGAEALEAVEVAKAALVEAGLEIERTLLYAEPKDMIPIGPLTTASNRITAALARLEGK